MTPDTDFATGNDPFERAMAREQAYREQRRRSSIAGFPVEMFKTIRWIALGCVLAWGGLVILHWRAFAEPRWLAVLHTMVYGFGSIYVAAILIAFTVMMRKRPEVFGTENAL